MNWQRLGAGSGGAIGGDILTENDLDGLTAATQVRYPEAISLWQDCQRKLAAALTFNVLPSFGGAP